MSLRPKTICSYVGCQRTIDAGRFCQAHQKIADLKEKARKNNHQSEFTKLYNWDWRKFRARYIKEHPLCVHCLKDGKLTPATVVDHIIPHKGDKELFWNDDNHQSLCVKCHNEKTAKYDGGFGRKLSSSDKKQEL